MRKKTFKKSSFCGSCSDCVEIKFTKASDCAIGLCVEVGKKDNCVIVRDSKNPDGVTLKFDALEWEAFIKGVKNGEFDFPE